MSLKILQIYDHSLPLHSGYVFRSLAILREQRKRGWETVHITTPRHTVAEAAVETIGDYSFYRTLQPDGILAKTPVISDFHQMSLTTGVIEKVIRAEKPDIIQANSPVLNAIPAIRAAARHNLPVVYEIRAFWEDAAVTAGKTTEGSIRYKMSRAFETYAIKHADAVTTICSGLRDEIVSRGVPPSKVTLIPNAVDIENFKPDIPRDEELAEKLDLNGKTVLGFIGSFYAYEGLDLLIKALPAALKKTANIALLLVGGGPMENELKSLSGELDVADRVIFTGRVPQTEVSKYYGLVDLLVYPRHPTRLTDLVTPLKPLEAMAQKSLFLASDVGGHKELVRDNDTGFLFRAGDLDDLTNRIVEILSMESSWPRILDNGRRFVETERYWEKSVSGYQEVYDRLLSKTSDIRHS
jgi:glycogen(starch) synthase